MKKKCTVLVDTYDNTRETFFENWDNMCEQLNECPYCYGTYAITGVCGLWDGDHTIVPVRVNGLMPAIVKCFDSCDDIVVEQVGGHLEINAMHHDGTNRFQIHLLNSKGERASNHRLTNSTYYKAFSVV